MERRCYGDDHEGDAVKIRIGLGLGTRTNAGTPEVLGPLVEAAERLRFDSMWFSERITGEAPDPLVAMTYTIARTQRLKVGMSVMVLPGRNPVVVAKEMASLDVLSGGRLLPAFGLGVADPQEQQAFGVKRGERAKPFDEALDVLRKLWTGEPVTHHGEFFDFEGVQVRPKPVQDPLEVWLGGAAPSELRRVGRVGDGWLPSFCTPEDVRDGRKLIEEAAAGYEREIDPEHFGALIAYSDGPLPDQISAFLAKRKPGVDPSTIIPSSLPALKETLERMVEVGTASKFVVVPFSEPDDWEAELEQLAAEVLPLQN
jgi:probable F420-dependent oxidoreductase